MSSLPARMAKRSLEKAGFSREWVKSKQGPETFPGRVLDPQGEPVASTWTGAAVHASRARRK